MAYRAVSATSCSVRPVKNGSGLMTSAPNRAWTKQAKTSRYLHAVHQLQVQG
jgi:hypothetical protein